MKVSLNWLAEFVELPPSVEELVHLLTMAGVEVEGVETKGCSIPNVVVAQIKESVQHPNADRLSVCQVDDGSGTARQIVCGAKNYKVGDKVPLALPGATLPGDFTIKTGKLRGVESQGMMCSGKELGLTEDSDGLLILPQDATVGAPISSLFEGDTVLDLEITPNRPDLLSHAGIGREIATLTGKALKLPTWDGSALDAADAWPVGVETAARSLYTARMIRGVKVAPSPDWLRKKLESVGLRPINNVVDITNYVMFALGQPLHAFDAAKIKGTLRVRNAKDGERFLALDGQTYELAAEDLVIADDERAVAIAGVMGGEETGVSETTTDVLLESAWFDPRCIRRSSRRLGLSSDSSYRFERGVDPATVLTASDYAAHHLRATCGGTSVGRRCAAANDDGLAKTQKAAPIQLRHERIERLLGTSVTSERVREILSGFGLAEMPEGWVPPSFRGDLTREIDLIEEVARVIGMDVIPSKTQARFVSASATDRRFDREMTLRRALMAAGFHEARSLTLVPAQPIGVAFTQFAPENLQRVKNPMIDDQVVLRPNLLHGLLTALRDNLHAGAESVRLFEIGRVFSVRKPEEFQHAAIVVSGPLSPATWRSAKSVDADLFALKGLITSACGEGVTFKAVQNPALALSLSIELGGKAIGHAGQLWPADARALDSTAPVLFAEVDVTALMKAEGTAGVTRRYREIPRFPAVKRDIALLAPASLAHAEIEAKLRSAEEPLLASVELFDVFTDPTGEKIPAGQKSLAYSLTYRSNDRTLTADEVSAVHTKLRERLKTVPGVSLRE